MKISKRGISPLIATVLIVGFTIALAAIVITWGQTFTRQIQQDTEVSSNQQITCATEVVFEVTNACDDSVANTVKITVKNDGTRNIDSFLIRSYRDEDDVEQDAVAFSGGIPSFGIESDTYSVDSEPILLVEAIPIITLGGNSVTCASNIKSFGDIDGSALLAC